MKRLLTALAHARPRRHRRDRRLRRPVPRALGTDAAGRDGRRAARQRPGRGLPRRAATAPAGHPLRPLVGAHRAAQARGRDESRRSGLRLVARRPGGHPRRRAGRARAAHDRGHAALGRRRHGQQAARQHGHAAGLLLRGRDALQRPAHRAVDRAGAARGDALGGLERAQHDEPSDAAVQLPLRERRAGGSRRSTPRS